MYKYIHQVSIHAPARGATQKDGQRIARDAVSIHAPARGATIFCLWHLFVSMGFNPRAREGRDNAVNSRHDTPKCFNPRAREGRDDEVNARRLRDWCFNPRAREGRDASGSRSPDCNTSFNPRAREGRDGEKAKESGRLVGVSIHAPARGATIRVRINGRK